jgi:hypothetical protein
LICNKSNAESLPSSALQTTVCHPPQQAKAIVYAAFLLKRRITRQPKTFQAFHQHTKNGLCGQLVWGTFFGKRPISAVVPRFSAGRAFHF